MVNKWTTACAILVVFIDILDKAVLDTGIAPRPVEAMAAVFWLVYLIAFIRHE